MHDDIWLGFRKCVFDLVGIADIELYWNATMGVMGVISRIDSEVVFNRVLREIFSDQSGATSYEHSLHPITLYWIDLCDG